MKTKVMQPTNVFERLCGGIGASILVLFHHTSLLSITIIDMQTLMKALGIFMLYLVKVGIAGLVGAACGAAGKKYFFPFVDVRLKKYFTTKKPKRK